MPTLEKPRLRPYVEPTQDFEDPYHVYLRDQLGLSARSERVTLQEYHCIRLFDGERTLREIQMEAIRRSGGTLWPIDHLEILVRRLDEAMFLDGPRFRSIVDHSIRPPRCLGVYPADAELLRGQIERLFTGPAGPGRPRADRGDDRLRAALIPHIDYPRGGHTYAWGFKEVFERTTASLFVIIGTSHYSPHRFTLTRKDFQTPLGIARTDQEFIDRLVKHHGEGLFDDELRAHLPEHSIELEVVFLQYLYESVRDIRIVPLVVGSFHDCVESGQAPGHRCDIRRLIEALRRAEAETPGPICYIISGDLAHIGPKFGDDEPVTHARVSESRRRDAAILEQAVKASPAGVFQVIASEVDGRRICGFPPTYTVLEAIRPSSGKLLHYDQYVHTRGHESVSFASVAFYR